MKAKIEDKEKIQNKKNTVRILCRYYAKETNLILDFENIHFY